VQIDITSQVKDINGSLWHYVLYPAALCMMSLWVLIWPSRPCDAVTWMSLLSTVGRTICAPRFVIPYGDNFMGGALTGLTKPLQDVQASFCHFASHHPQTNASIARFLHHSDLCSPMEHTWLMPILAALPLILRALQCARRYWDSRNEVRHIVNLSKYLAGLLVVITSVRQPSTAAVLLVSVVSTYFSASWDVFMDFGFSPSDLGWGSDTAVRLDAGFDGDAAATRASVARCWAAVFSNLVARHTWVLALLPITLLSEDIAVREGFKTALSAVEIARRAMWAVLRLKHEHLAKGGNKALFSVPSKLGSLRTVQTRWA